MCVTFILFYATFVLELILKVLVGSVQVDLGGKTHGGLGPT